MGKVIPEDVHAGCVEEAERLRKRLELVTAGARRMRCPEHATDASNGWGCPVCVYELRQSRAEWMSAARIHVQTIGLLDDRLIALGAALDGYAMDLAHTEALLEEAEGQRDQAWIDAEAADAIGKARAAIRENEAGRLRACLDRIEARAAGAAEYRNPPSYGRDYAAYWRDVVREERAEVEGKPAGEPTQPSSSTCRTCPKCQALWIDGRRGCDHDPAGCLCPEVGWVGPVCERGEYQPMVGEICHECMRCRACHAQPAEGGK
jgi:hypothetical protein